MNQLGVRALKYPNTKKRLKRQIPDISESKDINDCFASFSLNIYGYFSPLVCLAITWVVIVIGMHHSILLFFVF